VIVHLVLLKLRQDVTPSDIRLLARQLAELCQAIPDVKAAWAGPRRDIDAGYARSFGDSTYDYAAVLQFSDRDGLLRYLQHQDHRELGRRFWEVCQATVVFEGELFDVKRIG
jgi:hypothetical protein